MTQPLQEAHTKRGMGDYEAYLLDWDGTIANTLEVWLRILKEAAQSCGIEATDEQVISTVFGRIRAGFIELGVPESSMDKVYDNISRRAASLVPQADLYPGALQTLEELRAKGKKTAVISAAPRRVIDCNIEYNGLCDLIDTTISSDEVNEGKPNAEGIHKALGRLGVGEECAVMIGDSASDVGAARNAGIDSMLFHPPENGLFHDLEQLQADNPTHTIRSWHELLGQLQ